MNRSSGLIPKGFIEDLLVRVDLADLINTFVPLKKSGKNYQACCPFHDEKTPSFTVSPEKQFYYCFGCGAHGNAIGFVMKHLNMPFTESVERLADYAGVRMPERVQDKAQQAQKARAKPMISALDFAASYYQHCLTQKPDNRTVVKYLRGRNILQHTLGEYRVGFAPPGWNNLIDAMQASYGTSGKNSGSRSAGSDGGVSKRASLASAVEAGLVIQKSESKFYDRFRNRLMFPIRNVRGDVIAFGGRVLSPDDKPKYLNSPETPLFQKNRELYGLYEIQRRGGSVDRILVVEGYIDVLMLAQNGVNNAVATLGTSTSSGHLETLFKKVDDVVFCFDGDAAGKKAALRALETSLPLVRDGRQVRFLFLPDGEDPDSLVQKEGEAVFNQRVDQATTLTDFLVELASEGLDFVKLEDRARFVRNAAPMVVKLPSGIYKDLLIQHLAEKTQLDKSTIFDHLAAAEERKQKPLVVSGGYPGSGAGADVKAGQGASLGQHEQVYPSAQVSDVNVDGYGQGVSGGPGHEHHHHGADAVDYDAALAHYENLYSSGSAPQVGDHSDPFAGLESGVSRGVKGGGGQTGGASTTGEYQPKPEYEGGKRKKGRFQKVDYGLPPASVPSITEEVIRLLLHNPTFAKTCEIPGEVKELQLSHIDLLLELVTLLNSEPDCSTAYLFGHWHGTEKGDQLARIAAQEFVAGEEEGGDQRAFQEAIQRLRRLYIEQLLDRELGEVQPNPTVIAELLQKQRELTP